MGRKIRSILTLLTTVWISTAANGGELSGSGTIETCASKTKRCATIEHYADAGTELEVGGYCKLGDKRSSGYVFLQSFGNSKYSKGWRNVGKYPINDENEHVRDYSEANRNTLFRVVVRCDDSDSDARGVFKTPISRTTQESLTEYWSGWIYEYGSAWLN